MLPLLPGWLFEKHASAARESASTESSELLAVQWVGQRWDKAGDGEGTVDVVKRFSYMSQKYIP